MLNALSQTKLVARKIFPKYSFVLTQIILLSLGAMFLSNTVGMPAVAIFVSKINVATQSLVESYMNGLVEFVDGFLW